MERSVLLAATLTLAASWESTFAQCGPAHSCPGIYGFVDASTMWDPDGPGPHAPQAIFAGRFDFAGDVRAANIAMWDPATGLWSSLGAGVHGEEARIRALSTTAAGDLVVGGDFLFAGNSVCRNVARWDGNAWHAFGGGIDGQVAALAMLPTGDIVAAGNFVTASGTTLNHIGRWNGTTWSPLGGGLSARATAMAVLPGGGLAVFGHFQTAGTTTAPGAAVWNGTTWTALPPTALATANAVTLPNGSLVAMTTAGLATLTGSSWAPLPQPSTFTIYPLTALTAAPNGDLIATGNLFGGSPSQIGRWNGTTWAELIPNTRVQGTLTTILVLPNGDVVVGGGLGGALDSNSRFTATGIGVMRSNGVQWSSLAADTGLLTQVNDIVTMASGTVVACGLSYPSTGLVSGNIGMWNGASWSALGSGLNDEALAVTALPTGDVVVGGRFTTAGGVSTNHIARWNGTWNPLGPGLDGPVTRLITTPNGDVIATGYFGLAGTLQVNGIARWNGASWSALGTQTGMVRDMAALPNGNIAALPTFNPGPAIWNGTTWNPIPGALNGASAIAAFPNGDLAMASSLNQTVSRWDGTSWTTLGAAIGPVGRLQVSPSGDLVASLDGMSADRVVRWNGLDWLDVYPAYGTGLRCAFTFDASGAVVTTPRFWSPSLLYRCNTCPTAVVHGTGCDGNSIEAHSLPWANGVLATRSTATGWLAAIAFTSLTAIAPGAVPFSQFFPQSPPGCDLLVAPDIVLLPTAATHPGRIYTALFLPNTPPIVGVTFFQQFIGLNSTGGLASTAVLQLTGGAF